MDDAEGARNPASPRGMRLAKRLFGNYTLQTVNWGVRIFEQLLLVPLYLYAWGPDLYKDWIVIFAITVFLYWCSFGIDEYFGNVFLRLVSLGDHAGLVRQVKVGLFVATAITALILTVLYAGLVGVDLAKDLALSVMDNRTAILCLVLTTVPVWHWYLVEILKGVYRAYGDFTRGEAMIAITVSVQIGSIALALLFRQPPPVVALCYIIAPLTYAIVTVIDIRRRYPAVKLGLAVPTREEWRRIVPQSLLYFTGSLAQTFTQNVPLLIFGFLNLGSLSTIRFNLVRIYTGLTRQIGAHSFSIGTGIEMARQHAEGDIASCRDLYANAGRVVSCLVGILGGVSVAASDPFVALWTHGAVSGDMPLVWCFLTGIFLAAPGRISLSFLRYTNHAHAIAAASCGYALGGFALAVPLAALFGGFGVALAFAITETLAIGLFAPIAVGLRFHFGAARYLAQSYLAGALTFLASYGVAVALFDTGDLTLPKLLLKLGLWSLIIAPAAFLVVLPAPQRARLVSALRRRAAPLGRSA